MHIHRFFNPTNNWAVIVAITQKPTAWFLSAENPNNAYHLLEDSKQIDRSLLAAYKLARAKKIGKLRIKRLRQIMKLYVAALVEELTNTVDVAEI